MAPASEKKRRRKTAPLSVGELNRLIDALCHPLFKDGAGYVVLDGVLHGLVERNPSVSVRKFVRYSLPTLIAQAQGKSKRKRRKTGN